jgi:hypothetical protein
VARHFEVPDGVRLRSPTARTGPKIKQLGLRTTDDVSWPPAAVGARFEASGSEKLFLIEAGGDRVSYQRGLLLLATNGEAVCWLGFLLSSCILQRHGESEGVALR